MFGVLKGTQGRRFLAGIIQAGVFAESAVFMTLKTMFNEKQFQAKRLWIYAERRALSAHRNIAFSVIISRLFRSTHQLSIVEHRVVSSSSPLEMPDQFVLAIKDSLIATSCKCCTRLLSSSTSLRSCRDGNEAERLLC